MSGQGLAVFDVGNTSITVGFFQGRLLAGRGRIPTHGGYAAPLARLLKAQRWKPGPAIISSVVPSATGKLKKALAGAGFRPVKVVGQGVQAPVINRYRIPRQVGQDRLVNAAAAYFLYGGPAIVVDFGTAITIDVLSGRREYLGGLIVPGVEIAFEALVSRAALLPKVPLAPPRGFLGRDTVNSMRSGVFHGYAALCDGLVERLRREEAPRAKVIATGGHSLLIGPLCKTVQIINPDLTLQGLRLIYQGRP